MSVIWYEPEVNELEKQIEGLLQEQVKPGLDENKVYAKTIRNMIYKSFREYESRWMYMAFVGCLCSFYLGAVLI